ncbi:MAG TPA: SRPBCC family protein [Pseudonocardiaceae bacterium]|nr:SRPBCC family protein [Pseudonocardiaceae bacterium]
MKPWITRSVEIAADPPAVWAMVTDLPRMGEFSPENIGGRWLDGATGPAVGARYRGFNRHNGDGREWWTRVTVVEYEDRRLFTFDVRAPIGIRVSRWSYEIESTPVGCRLTEHWYRVGNRFVREFLGPRVTGRADRPGFNAESIEHTLAAVKAVAEAQARRRSAA